MLVLLASCAILVAVLRHMETGIPFIPGQERSVWLIEARVDFMAKGGAVSASLSLPDKQLPGFELYEEQSASPGYGFSIVREYGDRRAEWTKREALAEQSLYYSAQFVASDKVDPATADPVREHHPIYWDDAQELAAGQVLSRARETSSSARSLTRELIKLLSSPSSDQNTALLRSDQTSQAELLMRLLDRAGIATRSVMGLYLEDARRRQVLTPMVEIHTGEHWLLFNLSLIHI